jgi:hypothetical protein
MTRHEQGPPVLPATVFNPLGNAQGRLVRTLETTEVGHADLERIYLEHMHDQARPAGR